MGALYTVVHPVNLTFGIVPHNFDLLKFSSLILSKLCKSILIKRSRLRPFDTIRTEISVSDIVVTPQ